jgi:SAM-dependent methyltransferase
MVKTWNDFDWFLYHERWEEQYNDMTKAGYKHIVENFSVVDDELIIDDNVHENAKEIYCDIYRLKPRSVFEAGCGAGHHLINIKKTSPWVEVAGCDRNQKQLALGKRLFSTPDEIYNKLAAHNLVDAPYPGKYDFIFTNAVTMHIPQEDAIKFLKNVASMATKYVLLIENYTLQYYEEIIPTCFPEFQSGLLYDDNGASNPHSLRGDSPAKVKHGIGEYCGKWNSIWFLERMT